MSVPSSTVPPHQRRRARAAQSNASGRYEPCQRESFDDGWDIAEEEVLLHTEVVTQIPRRVITRNTSPDIHFDRSINPYRGCEHGCIYCFARPSHAFLGLSPGLDFETRLVARPDAAPLLREELSAPGYQVAPIAIGTNTDPYQPIEKRYRAMRGILEVLQEFRHPVTIVTKGALIERDLDILGEMARDGLVQVGVSVTTLDRELSRRMEPRAPSPTRRLATIGALAGAGCPVRLMAAPVIPGLTDHEIEAITSAAADAGATSAEWIMLRLPAEVSPLLQEWLARHYPDRAHKIMARVREMHGGKDYDSQWGRRMRGEGVFADLIGRRFGLAARRCGLTRERLALRCDLFRVPGRARQLSLF